MRIIFGLIDEVLGFAGEDDGIDDVDDAIGGFDVGDDDGRVTSELVGEDTPALAEGGAFQGAE